MALSPRTLIKSPMVLIAATISLGIAAAGMFIFFAATSCPSKTSMKPVKVVKADACQANFGNIDAATWSEVDYARLAECYQTKNDHVRAAHVAERGLNPHPNSELLFNVKAYNEIKMQDYESAVSTLRVGLQRVKPVSSVMENNLAWAGLWVPRDVSVEEARVLYRRALVKSPQSCETLHTGLWVEYAVAAKADGATRHQAVNQYNTLRERYNGCEKRLDNNQVDTVHEVLGAGVLDLEMAKLAPENRAKPAWARNHSGWSLVKGAVNRANVANAGNVREMCEMATPVASAHHACLRAVQNLKNCKNRR